MGSICLQGGACLPPSCRLWSELAAAPHPTTPPSAPPHPRQPPLLEGRPPGTAVCPPWRPCPDRTRSWPGLPACFSFRASPGCSPDIPEGTCRRQSRPGPGERAAGSPVARERHGVTFPSTSRTLLHPRRSPVHRFGASTLTSRPPGPGMNVSLGRAGLTTPGSLTLMGQDPRAYAQAAPRLGGGLPSRRASGPSWKRRRWNDRYSPASRWPQ